MTNENKAEFVQLKARWLLLGQKRPQLEAIADGFASVLDPADTPELSAFDPAELELLLCGVPTISLADWQANVEYRSGYSPAHPAVRPHVTPTSC